jgi:hypothetical protein
MRLQPRAEFVSFTVNTCYTLRMNYALLFTAMMQAAAPSSVGDAVVSEIASRPLADASDIYKLLHQSVFGVGHIIQSKESAKDYLLKEIATLEPTKADERLYEDIGGGMVRVNLRPFRDSKKSTDTLLQAMIESANSNSGTPETMANRINEVYSLLATQQKKELAEGLKSLAETQASKGYPALHHSEAYRNAYWPAYRIVEKRHLKLD